MIRGLIKIIKKVIAFIMSLIVTVVLIAVCFYVDARYIEPHLLCKEEVTLTTDKLQLKEALRIVQFSDVHLGKYYKVKDFQKVVGKINDLKPDLIIFTGDLLDDPKTFNEEEGTTKLLSKLQARYGVYAVFGNHDHGNNGTKLYTKIIKNAGITLLKNNHKLITLPDGQQIAVIGIDDIVLSKPHLEDAFKGVPQEAYCLFVSHAPDVAEEALKYKPDLQLSGHTHGGQVRLPIVGAPFTPPYGEKYIKGLYRVNGQMPLYVNVGIGTSQLPYRFLCPPTITVLSIEGEG